MLHDCLQQNFIIRFCGAPSHPLPRPLRPFASPVVSRSSFCHRCASLSSSPLCVVGIQFCNLLEFSVFRSFFDGAETIIAAVCCLFRWVFGRKCHLLYLHNHKLCNAIHCQAHIRQKLLPYLYCRCLCIVVWHRPTNRPFPSIRPSCAVCSVLGGRSFLSMPFFAFLLLLQLHLCTREMYWICVRKKSIPCDGIIDRRVCGGSLRSPSSWCVCVFCRE